MRRNEYYSKENHGPFDLVDIGPLELISGETLAPCKIAVATFGELNETRSNAILVPTWYSGTSKIIEQAYIGTGRALDPAHYFIIVVNQIGGGLSTSPSNWGGASSAFPSIAIGDDVEAQHRLISTHFAINKLALVVGGSMGGQQAFEWAVRCPNVAERLAVIAATASATDHLRIFLDAMTDTIVSDPAWAGGDYEYGTDVSAGLKRHARLWSVMGWSPEFYRRKRFEALGYDSAEAFVDGFMVDYFGPMDPANLVCMIKKARSADPIRGGDRSAGFAAVTAATQIMPIDTDMFFTVEDCQAEAALVPHADLRVLNSTDGHLALFGADTSFLGQVDQNLKELLRKPV